MIVRRFGLAKEVDGDIKTPLLLKCEKDVRYDHNGENFIFLDYPIKKEILYPPSIKQSEVEIKDKVYLIPNINTMIRDSHRFVEYTINIREKYGYEAIFYAPGVPENLIPILIYMGYDIFDDCLSKIKCTSLWGSRENCERDAEYIFSLTVRALKDGRLREFIEGIPNNKTQEILRILDFKYYDILEQFYPIYMDSLNAVTVQSIYRPDIIRWRERILNRYNKPKYAKYLLLLPCSARKPYSESRSHKLMRRYIKSTMHEVILTSPLGLVPRELERFYPAMNYDIPVVGIWYEEEKKMIKEILGKYLNKFEYDKIISFLPENMNFLEGLLQEYDAEMIWGKNLDALAEKTSSLNYKVSRSKVLIDNIKSLSTFQFDIDFDFSYAKLRGRAPRLDIIINNKRFFGFDIHRGMLTLTLSSAKKLVEEGKYVVEIDDFHPEGDVFAAGIVNASPEIRISDEVAVAYQGELRAWGTARMSSYDMRVLSHGKAVKIRGRSQ